jgi:hypothetical protein
MAEARQPEIKVELTGDGPEVRPDSIELKGKREKVDSVLATWTEGGQGPSGRYFSNRLNRTFFRLRLKDGSVYEIAHELPENRKSAARWVLVQQLQAQPSQEGRGTGGPEGQAKAADTKPAVNAKGPARRPSEKSPAATKTRGKAQAGKAKSKKA